MTTNHTDLSAIRPVIIVDDGYEVGDFLDISHEAAAALYVSSGDWNIDEVGHFELVIWTWEPEWLDDDGIEREGFERIRHTLHTADIF